VIILLDSTETLEWTIEGIVSGSFGSAAADEAIPHPPTRNVYYIKKTYTISAAEMALITADGEITITLQNSSAVNTGFASTALVFGSDSFRYSLEYQEGFVFGDFIISLSPTVGGGITGAQSGADVTLSALADEGYVFDQWSGDASGSANPLQFVIDADRTILAEFIPDLADTDGDGLSNYAEAILYGSDPNSADPFDSLAGYYEPDRSTEDLDGDGIRNREELGYGSDPNDPAAIPADGITSNLEVSQWDFTYLNHHAAAAPESAVALAAGLNHSLALKADGTVVAWGSNYLGQTDVPAGLSDAVALAAGVYHSLALKADGTVVAWGYNGSGQTDVPAGLSDAVALAAGRNHSLALKADGTVVAWGYNGSGETDVPAGLSDAVALAAGGSYSLALKADGTVVAWGGNGDGQTDVPAGLSDAVALAAGWSHSLALKADGTVVAWGDNLWGQTDVPAGLSDAVALAAGGRHSLALKADGTVVAWGSNYWGETDVPAGLSDAVALAAGGNHSLALKADGTVVAWGYNNSGETDVPAGLANYNREANFTLDPLLSVTFPSAELDAGSTAQIDFSVSANTQRVELRRNGTLLYAADDPVLSHSVPLVDFDGSQAGIYEVIAYNDYAVKTERQAIELTGAPVLQVNASAATPSYALANGARSLLSTASIDVSLSSSFPNSTICYTLDGSAPLPLPGSFYEGTLSFPAGSAITLRAVAYNVDFSQSVEMQEVLLHPADAKTLTIEAPSFGQIQFAASSATASAGAYSHAAGSTLWLEAVADADYHFVAWEDGSTEALRALTLTADTLIAATFAANHESQVARIEWWRGDDLP
jgi:hypothetical protein